MTDRQAVPPKAMPLLQFTLLNADWELRSAVLQTQQVEGSHKAQNIATYFEGG